MMPSWYATQVWIGALPLNVWGTFVAAGFLTAVILAVREAPTWGIAKRDVTGLAVWIIVGGWIGARLGHVLFYEPAYYFAHLSEVVAVWRGGLSSFGGFFGALIAAWWFTRRRAPAWSIVRAADLLLWPLALGWFIGRLGCYSIHDHSGIPCNGFFCVPFPDGARRLDMGLLDGLLALGIFLALLPFRRRLAEYPGATTAAVIGVYGVGRFVLDFFRVGDATYLGLTPAQVGSVALVVCALWIVMRRGPQRV